jgi:H+-transporting ATPase
VTLAGVIIGLCDLLFCIGVFAFGKFQMSLDLDALRTLATILIVFTGEASLYAIRERRRIWSSRPGLWVIVSSAGDVVVISALATLGLAMAALPVFVVLSTLGAATLFAFALDMVKVPVFKRLKIS